MQRAFVTVTKLWHHPGIQILVTNEAIGMRMGMDDFIQALKAEIGNPGVDIEGAVKRIVEGIKEESKKAV
jgi:hypothetical protein